MLQTLLLLAVLVGQSLQQTAECSSPPLPALNGACPPNTILVLGDGCCPAADLLATTVATTVTVTDPTASTTSASGTVTVTTRVNSSCADLLNPRTGVSDCPAMAAFCTNSVYLDVMRVQCRRTCGFCSNTTSTTVSGSCADLLNPLTGVSDCPRRTALCNDSNYIALMRVQCPRTCGFCNSSSSTTVTSATSSTTASSTCVDQVNPATGTSECAANIGLCNNSAYATLMRTQCPRTCGFCTVG